MSFYRSPHLAHHILSDGGRYSTNSRLYIASSAVILAKKQQRGEGVQRWRRKRVRLAAMDVESRHADKADPITVIPKNQDGPYERGERRKKRRNNQFSKEGPPPLLFCSLTPEFTENVSPHAHSVDYVEDIHRNARRVRTLHQFHLFAPRVKRDFPRAWIDTLLR